MGRQMAGKGKRGNGEGSITLFKKGEGGKPDQWMARLTLPDGRRKALYAPTRAEAARKLTAALRNRDMGLRSAGDERQTLATYLTSWLATVRTSVKPRTYDRYGQAIRTHILPALGSVKLTNVSASALQQFYAAKLSEGLAPGTVAHLHAVIHRALDAAMRLDLIARNPADRVTAPRPTHHDMRILSQEQAVALLAGVAGDRLEALYVLALSTGARQGELLGARWADVNLDAGTLRIEHTLHFDRAGVWRLAPPKTERSRRILDLPPMAVEALRRHRARQLKERLQVGEAWNGHDFVLCNELGQPLRGQHLYDRHFQPTLARLGLPAVRWHDLRHTYVSLAAAEGVPVSDISASIGHSSVSMTSDVYLHILPGAGKRAALAMERALRAHGGGIGEATEDTRQPG
ncbi:MAG: tyrosine-type recombinase/integrase [Ktedonobacterales bacterium]